MIWILSEVYYPEETGTGYYVTQIAQHLALSYEVSAICAQPAYSRAGTKAPRYESHKGVHISRCPSLVLHQRSILMRLMRMATVSISMLVTALFKIRRGDTILAVTNPPSVPMLATLLSLMVRVRIVLLVHDVYPDMLAACQLTSKKAFTYKCLQRISRYGLRRAKVIICIGRDMRDHLALSRDTGTSDGIEVIPLWSDCDDIHPSPRESNSLISKLGLSDKMVFLYAGNMGHPHGIETLAAAIKRLETDAEIHFLFIGSGPKLRILEEMMKEGSENISLLSPLPRSAQTEFLNACDAAILSLVPGLLGLAVPSRTYNLMAAGKPIIALVSNSSEVARVIREEQIGWVVEPGAVDETVRAIQAAKESRAVLSAMGARARHAAETKYSPRTILKQFDNLFESLTF